MAENDSTTKTPPKGGETCFTQLSDGVYMTFYPIEAFYTLLDKRASGDVENVLLVLRPLLDRQQDELEKICEVIDRTIGRVRLESPMYGEVVEFAGRKFKDDEFIRAVVEPVKLQAVPKGGE